MLSNVKFFRKFARAKSRFQNPRVSETNEYDTSSGLVVHPTTSTGCNRNMSHCLFFFVNLAVSRFLQCENTKGSQNILVKKFNTHGKYFFFCDVIFLFDIIVCQDKY